jgi:2-methylisocitrate lyase-like PEP mutase family enzyme
VEKLSQLFKGSELVVAPVALNPIMAQMAAESGFKAVYLSGGSLGWDNGVSAGPAPRLRSLCGVRGAPRKGKP